MIIFFSSVGFHSVPRLRLDMAAEGFSGRQFENHNDRHHQSSGGQSRRNTKYIKVRIESDSFSSVTNGLILNVKQNSIFGQQIANYKIIPPTSLYFTIDN